MGDPDAGEDWGRGVGWLDSIAGSVDMGLGGLRELVMEKKKKNRKKKKKMRPIVIDKNIHNGIRLSHKKEQNFAI